jgi:hypothetical protein
MANPLIKKAVITKKGFFRVRSEASLCGHFLHPQKGITTGNSKYGTHKVAVSIALDGKYDDDQIAFAAACESFEYSGRSGYASKGTKQIKDQIWNTDNNALRESREQNFPISVFVAEWDENGKKLGYQLLPDNYYVWEIKDGNVDGVTLNPQTGHAQIKFVLKPGK